MGTILNTVHAKEAFEIIFTFVVENGLDGCCLAGHIQTQPSQPPGGTITALRKTIEQISMQIST
jgi:hypothetical protein